MTIAIDQAAPLSDRWGRPAAPGASCGHCGQACQVVERPGLGDSPLRLRSACCTAYVHFTKAAP